jgi:hypothetical protein
MDLYVVLAFTWLHRMSIEQMHVIELNEPDILPLFQCWHELVACLGIHHTFIQHIHVADEFYVCIVHTS